jgi:hypothetical protein
VHLSLFYLFQAPALNKELLKVVAEHNARLLQSDDENKEWNTIFQEKNGHKKETCALYHHKIITLSKEIICIKVNDITVF